MEPFLVEVIRSFIDNIFRFTQAGSEVSALLGRMPSAVGYQPTLATDLDDLRRRIENIILGFRFDEMCIRDSSQATRSL